MTTLEKCKTNDRGWYALENDMKEMFDKAGPENCIAREAGGWAGLLVGSLTHFDSSVLRIKEDWFHEEETVDLEVNLSDIYPTACVPVYGQCSLLICQEFFKFRYYIASNDQEFETWHAFRACFNAPEMPKSVRFAK